jgi:hypothetical protein
MRKIFLFILISAVIAANAYCATAIIEVSGKGSCPVSMKNTSQGDLLARRAAIVDAYRNLLNALRDVKPYLLGGKGYISQGGFIKGMRILSETKNADGRVELIVGLNVNLRDVRRLKDARTKRYSINYGINEATEASKEITREEWLEIINK